MTKILVIDDDPSIEGAYKNVFESRGWTVITADNGADGLKVADREQPNYILLDMLMPQMGGVEFLENFFHVTREFHPVIFVMTNSAVPEDSEQHVRRLGAKEYLIKANTSVEQLVGLIQKYLPPDNNAG